MIVIDINKKKYEIGFDDCYIEYQGNVLEFSDIKEMTFFINKVSDAVEKELNQRGEKNGNS